MNDSSDRKIAQSIKRNKSKSVPYFQLVLPLAQTASSCYISVQPIGTWFAMVSLNNNNQKGQLGTSSVWITHSFLVRWNVCHTPCDVGSNIDKNFNFTFHTQYLIVAIKIWLPPANLVLSIHSFVCNSCPTYT